ncbi:hypothetical protein [Methylomonas koyamae]|uniref:hypothetical protein n=1 Tax=Methylomonas koyamae TaxID=702114 RepID=UPI0028733496|nr:hypothetical protein [Methylomonas koyamae]WNB74556.1 hypothetical protein RI210_14835 [Methylomonas koyamae]
MPENLRITKSEMIRAVEVKQTVGAAADALAKIDVETLGLSAADAKTVAKAAKILGTTNSGAQAVIDQANSQFMKRDVNLINLASSRFFYIDRSIEELQSNKFWALKSFDDRTEELKKQRFNQDEINAILSGPAPEIEALQKKIDALVGEKSKIEKFLGDAPMFDPGLLAGTSLSSQINMSEVE